MVCAHAALGARRRHGIATIAFLASLGMFTRSSGPCFWIKPPKLRPVQGWYEEERLVAPEGGAKLRGPHPPKPPKFLMEGRIKNSPLEPQPEAEVSAETSEVSMLRVEDKQVGRELRYLSLAKQEALPVVGEDVRALVERASEEAQCGALQAEDLSSTLRAIATFKNQLPALKTHLGVISDTLLGRALDLQATGTSDALWAVAEMRDEAPMLQALLPVLVYRLAKTAPELTTEETISSLFSTAMLRSKFRELKLNMAPLTAFLANSMSKVSFEDLKTQELVDFFYSLSLTRTLPDDLFEALVTSSVDQLKGRKLSTHNTYSLLYSIAMLQETCVHGTALKLLPSVLISLEAVAEDMMPEQLAGCLWALGWADPNATVSRGHLERLRDEIGVVLGELKMRDLSHALWGTAALDFNDKELLGIAADRFLAWHVKVKAPILAKHIARVTWAFAKLDFHHKLFKLALEERLQPHKYVIRFLEPDQLHALAWSFRILMPGSRWQKTRDDIDAKIMAYVKMRYRHGIGRKVDEYGDERLHKVTVGRIEPYVEIDPETPKELRNQVMLEKAKDLGAVGPDVPNVRRKISGRPKWSVTQWVDAKKRFLYYAQQDQQKMLPAASPKQLEASSASAGKLSGDQFYPTVSPQSEPQVMLIPT